MRRCLLPKDVLRFIRTTGRLPFIARLMENVVPPTAPAHGNTHLAEGFVKAT
jgi:hypothetical protein